ncbi:YrhK family protein [Agrococcus sp. 1P02AA]|uniref:YrhK family protein n=1 Tax=Agrococcus sp. 1P02AA TaxID=3132259 RepID=UPI0039A7744E
MSPDDRPGDGRRAGADPGPDDLEIPVSRSDEIVIRNRYETLSILNDVLIGILFVVGSVLFLSESTSQVGTWFFVVGSAQFLLRPVIRLSRRFHLKRFGPERDRTDHAGDY